MPAQKAGAATTEDFISELVAELEDLEAPAAEPAISSPTPEKTHEVLADVFASTTPAPMAAANARGG